MLCEGTEEQKAWSAKKKKQMCNYSSLGCPQCDEEICKKCWEKGFDMHKKK